MRRSISHADGANQQVRELFQRAVAHIRSTHLFDALASLDELLALDPHHADGLACRGWIHALHHQMDLSRADLQAALRHAPDGWPRRGEVEAQLALEHQDEPEKISTSPEVDSDPARLHLTA